MDERWHALLLSRRANPHLVRLVEQAKPLIQRYEIAYFRTTADTERSIEEPRSARGDGPAGAQLVRTADHEEGAR